MNEVQYGTPASAEPKRMLTGLLDRDGPPPQQLQGVIRSFALRMLWKDIQPTQDGPLTIGALDRALKDAADQGTRVKLRVLAGVNSPEWAKELGGQPVQLTDRMAGGSGTVPRFWTPAFGRAYATLQQRLAARYDSNQVLAEVAISRCTVFYAEPFLRQAYLAANRSALLRAGYTPRADRACHRAQINAHRVWTRTRSGLAVNPAQFVASSHRTVIDDAFTARMMRFCRHRLGERCVLQNLSIRSPISSLDQGSRQRHYQRMYRALTRQGPPLAFQTATASRIGHCGRTLRWAIDRRAAYVELPDNLHKARCTRAVLNWAADRLR